MTYQNIQYIAYVLNTAPAEAAGIKTYVGLPDTPTDIKARCALMARAVEAAAKNVDTASTTLKVFMAPEFFFRGVLGAYTLDDASTVVETLKAMAGQARWKDWVFVFGTIIAYALSQQGDVPREVYNFALTQLGAAHGDAGANVVMKEWMAAEDFIVRNDPDAPNPGHVMYADMVEHMTAGNPGPGAEQQRRNYDGGGIFQRAGVTFGMEVCLDHLDQVNRLANSPQLPGGPRVQVQLVPSCGMFFNGTSVVTGPDGHVFNCDGLGHGATINAIGNAEAPPVPQVVPVDASNLQVPNGTPPSVPVASLMAVGADFGTGAGVRVSNAGADAGAAAGNVVVFAAVALPPASIVPLTVVTQHFQFDFTLHYKDNGGFDTATCLITVLDKSAAGLTASCDLNSSVQFASGTFSMDLCAGADGYEHGITCKVDFKNLYQFQGMAFEFFDRPELHVDASPRVAM